MEDRRNEESEEPKNGDPKRGWPWWAVAVFALLLALVFATIGYFLGKDHHSRRHRRDVLSWESSRWKEDGTAGHPIEAVMLSEKPRVMLLRNFLTAEECQHLQALGEPKMKRSTVQGVGEDGSKGTNVLSKHRTSWTANLERAHDAVVRRVERRAALWCGYPLENVEPLQIVSYRPKQEYKRHFDYFIEGTDGAAEALVRGGQRRVTFFAYLNTLEENAGGETHFTELGLKVKPVAGDAVMFHDCTPDGKVDPKTAHAGMPPLRGTKMGVNVWVRERKFV